MNTHSRLIPIQFTSIKTVLTKDPQGMYAVYMGMGTDHWVKDCGVKLCYEEALQHYPMLQKSEYKEVE